MSTVSIGIGVKTFLFAVGELGMLHVTVSADSLRDALRYIRSGECLEDFPPQLREEILGEEFRLLEEIS